MKSGKKSTWMTTVVMLIVVALVVVAFLQMKNAMDKNKERVAQTEVEKLLARDLEQNYPGNAREVVRFYNRIVKCFYNEELTDEELSGLASQARLLFDTELLKRNPPDQYLENLKAEIEVYRLDKLTITNIETQEYRDVVFKKKGSENTASMLVYYLMREDRDTLRNHMRFYLREDEEGRWRILFWEATSETFER